jgi:hypothetical protein
MPPLPADQRRTLRFWRSRATRNKWVYQEEVNRGDAPAIGVIYLDKGLLEQWGDPESIDVVLTPTVR